MSIKSKTTTLNPLDVSLKCSTQNEIQKETQKDDKPQRLCHKVTKSILPVTTSLTSEQNKILIIEPLYNSKEHSATDALRCSEEIKAINATMDVIASFDSISTCNIVYKKIDNLIEPCEE